MNESFDRILDLAQKTNTRLIVYDRNGGKHLVIMGIDEFEGMNAGSIGPKPPTPELPTHDHDAERDRVLIEALNREIADWRSKAQQRETESTAEAISQDPPPTASTIPLASASSWHRFGDVLAGVYQNEPSQMPEVRYEPAPSEVGEKTESLDEDPIFLEEPVE